MRELKFRMVTQTTGKLLGYVDIYDLLRNGSDVLPDFEEAILEGVNFEQYTGLKDKNGEEIYEGDILDVSSVFVKPNKMVVEFSEMACGFEPFVNGCPDCYVPIGKDVVVIGNIHENKELLGGEE